MLAVAREGSLINMSLDQSSDHRLCVVAAQGLGPSLRYYDFEQHLLVYCNEFLVPLADVGCPLACFFLARLIRCWKWVIAVVFAVF